MFSFQSKKYSQKNYFCHFSCFYTTQCGFLPISRQNLWKTDGANVTLFYYLWHKFEKYLQTISTI